MEIAMNWKETCLAIALVTSLVAVTTGAVKAQMFASSSLLDQKDLGELKMLVEISTIDGQNKKKLKAMKEIVGRAFWSECFKQKVLEAELMGKLASLGSACGDTPSDGKWLDEENGKLEQRHCSYTSPKADMLCTVMNLKGSKRCVLFTFDSRNWKNYGKKGVLVAWSEGDGVEFLSPSTAANEWRIDEHHWANPVTQIGQVKPFHYTYQEAECAAYVNPDAPKKDDTDYCAIYRKKGRSWTFSGTEKRDGKDIARSVRCTVKEVKDNEATLVVEQLNDEGNVKPDGSDEQVVDLSDMSQGRPSHCKLSADAETEIEAAGKKWKVRKWVQFDGKRTYWMSTVIPGLVVKAEMSNGATLMLSAFKEGE
jgi:hypothetical protein